MYTTLNNHVAEHIIQCAIEKKHRFCAYSLFNHFYGETFDLNVFYRLFDYVVDILRDNAELMFKDDSIDYCVRIFINRLYDHSHAK